MFCLLHLCFVFYGEIYFKNGKLCSFLFCHSILFLPIMCGEGSPQSVLKGFVAVEKFSL